MSTTAGGRWSQAGRLALLALVLTPLTILIHELGHFAVAWASGLPAALHPTSVSGGAAPGSAQPGWMIALQAGGGPLVTIAMSLAGALLYRRDPSRLWALAFSIAAASRFGVTTAYLGVRGLLGVLGRPFGGRPNFDEHNVSAALGVPTEPLAIMASLYLAGLLYWLLKRAGRGRRIVFVLAVAAAIVIGNIVWVTFPPPVLATLPAR